MVDVDSIKFYTINNSEALIEYINYLEMTASHEWSNKPPFSKEGIYGLMWDSAVGKKVAPKTIFAPEEVRETWESIKEERRENWIGDLKENHHKYKELDEKFGHMDKNRGKIK